MLDELDRRLGPVGLRCTRSEQRQVTAIADAITAEALRRIWRAHLALSRPQLRQARLVHQVRVGRRTKTLTNHQQVRTAQLTNAGI